MGRHPDPPKAPRFCPVAMNDGDPCGRRTKHQPTGYCDGHYKRYRSYGDPTKGKQAGVRKPEPPIKHGLTGYTSSLCRCSVCREANNVASKSRYQKVGKWERFRRTESSSP